MKKFFDIFLITLLIFSCSSDSDGDNNNNDNNNNNNNNNNLLVSRVISDDLEDNSYSSESIFNYDGNKIVSVENKTYYNGNLSNTSYSNYYYTNNKITLINNVDSNNNINSYTEYDYDSQGRAIEERYFSCTSANNCDLDESNTLTYNSNGSVSMVYTYNGVEEESATINFDNNHNATSGISTFDGGSYSFTAEYDNKNHAFKNITGINNLGVFSSSISGVGYYYGYYGLNNNPTNIVEQVDDDEGQDIFTINITYDYNDDNYPRNIISEDVGFGTETMVIEYY